MSRKHQYFGGIIGDSPFDEGLIAEVLVVGGGGSGPAFYSGEYFGSGGNGGDVKVGTSFVLNRGVPLSVEVGSGGAGVSANSYTAGNAGTRSIFGALEAAGAGAQPHPNAYGVAGGTAVQNPTISTVLTAPLITLTTTTTTQYAGQQAGYSQYNCIVGGGAGGYADTYSSTGGHRAGPGYLWGVNNTRYAGGGGTSGITSSSTGYWPYLGGLGGGGDGVSTAPAAGGSGTANTGGGGGGGYEATSGAGGSGVVLVWLPQTGYTAANNKYSQTGLTITETDNFTNAATSAVGTLLTITAHSGSASITFT